MRNICVKFDSTYMWRNYFIFYDSPFLSQKNLSNYVNKTQDNILFSTMYGVINCYLYDTLCPFDSL